MKKTLTLKLLAGAALLASIAISPALAKDKEVAASDRVSGPPYHHLTGLKAPAQILVDRWGVPHIYAATADDLFFAQGFNAARDRLFQIDLWRRRGLGRLAAVFGANFVEQDRAARLFLYRGDMAREWAALRPRRAARREPFVAGINAYIDLI